MSAIQIKARRLQSNSLSEFRVTCQQFKWSPEGTQQLTFWIFHGSNVSNSKWRPGDTATHWLDKSMSAIQTEPKRHTFTHFLDEISG